MKLIGIARVVNVEGSIVRGVKNPEIRVYRIPIRTSVDCLILAVHAQARKALQIDNILDRNAVVFVFNGIVENKPLITGRYNAVILG